MAQKTSTVNISFRKDLLEEIDEVARIESRTRSELLREAARMYIERKRRWKLHFAQAEKSAAAAKLTDDAIVGEIKKYRSGR